MIFSVFLCIWSGFLSLLFLKAALNRGILPSDKPNHRSSHTTVVPRGGGTAFGLAWWVSVGLLWVLFPELFTRSLQAILGAIFSFWALGVVEDYRGIPAGLRLSVQLIGTSLFFWGSGLGWERLSFADFEVHLSTPWRVCFSVVWSVGLINFYNFMDGINGLAAVVGLVASAVWALSSGFLGISSAELLLLALMGVLCGFLPLNFRRSAKVFMGDSGSLFLGAVFAFFPFLLHVQKPEIDPLFSFLVLCPLLLDALLTLLKRVARKENFLQAHRSHFYQQLSRQWGDHVPVSGLYGAVTLGFGVLVVFSLLENRFVFLHGAAALLLGILGVGYFLYERVRKDTEGVGR